MGKSAGMTQKKDIKWSWKMRAVCGKCGWHTEAPHGDLFHVAVNCCPCCGNIKPQWGEHSKDWSIKRMRWVSKKSTWYKPGSWGKGYWETFKESEEK